MDKMKGFEKMFRVIATQIEHQVKEFKDERGIGYGDADTSITSLLYCPLKWKFRKEYPQITSYGNDIAEGFFWEDIAKKAFVNAFGSRVLIEPEVTITVNGKKIAGHPDIVLRGNKNDVIIELKAPRFTKVLPAALERAVDGGVLVTSKYETEVSKHYLVQVALQKYMWKANYNIDVLGVVFMKTFTRDAGKLRRVFIAHVVDAEATQEFVEKLVESWEVELPRHPWECNLCIYREFGICEGKKETNPIPYDMVQLEQQVETSEDTLPAEVEDLFRQMYYYEAQMKEIEDYLRRILPKDRTFKYGNKEVGWTLTEYSRWNVAGIIEEALKRNVPIKAISEALYISKNKIDRLYALLGDAVDQYRKVDTRYRFKK